MGKGVLQPGPLGRVGRVKSQPANYRSLHPEIPVPEAEDNQKHPVEVSQSNKGKHQTVEADRLVLADQPVFGGLGLAMMSITVELILNEK